MTQLPGFDKTKIPFRTFEHGVILGIDIFTPICQHLIDAAKMSISDDEGTAYLNCAELISKGLVKLIEGAQNSFEQRKYQSINEIKLAK